MGRNNRERRRAKKLKRQKDERPANAPRRNAGGGFTRPSDCRDDRRPGAGDEREDRADRGDRPFEPLLRSAVLAAAEAFRVEPEAVYRSRLDALALLEARAGRGAIDGAVAWWVERGLDQAWASGWQPADVMRMIRRILGSAHAEGLGPAVAESGVRRPEAAADDRWAVQVASIGDDGGRSSLGRGPDVSLAVEAISVLLHLPPLPRLSVASDRRADGRRDGSGAMLERVRALLAKAESTTFPKEAEAFTAKAQELMARHAINQAMLDVGRTAGPADVVGWRIGIDDPYAAAKSLLLDRIAVANRCRAVWSKRLWFSTVFGTRSDLEMVEILFTSLLVQGTDAMLRAGRAVDRSGRSRTRSFRQSFLVAYATRIGERLSATTAEVVADAERRGDAVLPVLASRAEAVDDAVMAAYPDMVERGMAISNYAGWAAGRAAAEVASLAVGDELAAG